MMLGAAGEPVADLEGPIHGGAKGWPLGGFALDLGHFGYLEQEFRIAGEAQNYRAVGEFARPDGRIEVTPGETRPYRTRILVQRPADPARFNGTVLVEWINVSRGRDWLFVPDRALLDGFAYVGVSAQCVGVHGFASLPPHRRSGLLDWDPERYAGLHHPGDSFSFDIFSQAARLLRDDAAALRILGTSGPRRLVAIGGSQSAMRLRAHLNIFHPRDRVFDGYLPFLDYGNICDLTDFVFEPHRRTPDYEARVFRHPVRVRADIDVPVMVVNSELEALRHHGEGREFLSHADFAHYRLWEVAGATHEADLPPARLPWVLSALRDGLPTAAYPASPPGSTVSIMPSLVAACHRMHEWLVTGAAPPGQPRLRFSGGPAPVPERDRYGIMLGGIRLPETEVPIAMNSALGDDLKARRNAGFSKPFDRDTLARLYPSREDYLGKVAAEAREAERRGVIVEARVGEYNREASALSVFDG